MRNQKLSYRSFIGQEDIVTRLRAFTDFFDTTGSTPSHVLLIGEDGMGKASLATALANERDVGFQEVDAASLENFGDVSTLMLNIKPKQVLLLANIHQLRRCLVERFREILHDGKETIIIGMGPAQRKHTWVIPLFTLVATCPKKADCPAELLREFSLVLPFQPYSALDLSFIAESIGKTEGFPLDESAATLIARSCDGCPGNLEAMLSRVARAINKNALGEEDVLQAFKAFGINVGSETSLNLSDNLQSLSGIDFEKLIEMLLVRMGFQAETTKTTGDGGIDIIAFFNKPIFGGRYLFQCKRFAPDNLVGAPTVRDFYGAVTADRAMKGILVTTSGFTAQAREFAQRVGIELVDLTQLQKLFLDYGLAGTEENKNTTDLHQ